MADSRIIQLPIDPAPSADDVAAIDSAVKGTRGATLTAMVNAGRPLASQAEAEAGIDSKKAMTPLSTKQGILAIGGANFATTAQGAKADTALQPEDLDAVAQKFFLVAAVDVGGGDPASAYAAGNVIDSVTLVAGQSILRATPGGDPFDGIYVVPVAGAASRHPDYDQYDDMPGGRFRSYQGNAYVDTNWYCDSEKGGTLGTTDLLFIQDICGAIAAVETLGDLKALNSSSNDLAILNAGDRAQFFAVRSGDYSTQIAADTNGGSYVKPDDSAASEKAWVGTNLLYGDVIDFFRDFQITRASSSGAAVNVTAAWDQAVIECNTRNKKLLLRGFFDGSQCFIKVDSGRQMPAQVFVDGQVTIVGEGTGDVFTRTAWMYGEGRLTIDGGNENDAVFGGYVKDHVGLYIGAQVEGGVGPTEIEKVDLLGWSFKNFGEAGLITQYVTGGRFIDIDVDRCGNYGMAHWSPLDCLVEGGRLSRIFPGETIGFNWSNNTLYTADSSIAIDTTNGFVYYCEVTHTSASTGTFAEERALNPTYWRVYWERAAYGITASQWSAHRQAENVTFRNITVDDVVSWTGLDMHSVRDARILGCRVTNTSQPIALENHLSGVRMGGIQIANNNVRGFGVSAVKDGTTCYSMSGINVNADGLAGSLETQNIQINDNIVQSVGETRPGISGGGAIRARHGRNIQINNNSIYDCYQSGVHLLGENDSTDYIISSQVNGNLIDTVIAHAGIQKGITTGSRVQGSARGNFVMTSGISAANAYSTPGTHYSFSYGTVTDISSATSQGDNSFQN